MTNAEVDKDIEDTLCMRVLGLGHRQSGASFGQAVKRRTFWYTKICESILVGDIIFNEMITNKDTFLEFVFV